MPNDTWYNTGLKTERECNEWLWCSLKNYPAITGFVTVNPGNPDSSEILAEYINKGFKGAKVHPAVFQIKIGDVSHEQFYSTTEDLNVPVLFHTGSHGWQPNKYRPALIGQLASRHPMLKIIIEHTGRTDYFNEALDVLKNNPNCYAGITSTIIETIEDGRANNSYLGAERLMLLFNLRIPCGLPQGNSFLSLRSLRVNFQLKGRAIS